MTDFKDILIKYMEELDCSSKELADSSGLSAATISRYRSGERIPDVESDNLKQLIYGIVKLAQKRNLSSINDITVHSDFLRFLPDISADFSILQANLNTLSLLPNPSDPSVNTEIIHLHPAIYKSDCTFLTNLLIPEPLALRFVCA